MVIYFPKVYYILFIFLRLDMKAIPFLKITDDCIYVSTRKYVFKYKMIIYFSKV